MKKVSKTLKDAGKKLASPFNKISKSLNKTKATINKKKLNIAKRKMKTAGIKNITSEEAKNALNAVKNLAIAKSEESKVTQNALFDLVKSIQGRM
jgi:hypothetical protein